MVQILPAGHCWTELLLVVRERLVVVEELVVRGTLLDVVREVVLEALVVREREEEVVWEAELEVVRGEEAEEVNGRQRQHWPVQLAVPQVEGQSRREPAGQSILTMLQMPGAGVRAVQTEFGGQRATELELLEVVRERLETEEVRREEALVVRGTEVEVVREELEERQALGNSMQKGMMELRLEAEVVREREEEVVWTEEVVRERLEAVREELVVRGTEELVVWEVVLEALVVREREELVVC